MAITDYFVVPTGSALNGGTSEADAWDLDTGLGSLAADVRINIKAGNYLGYAGIGGMTGGTVSNPAIIRGYASTTGDGYQGRDSNGNLITTNMPYIGYQNGVSFDIGSAANYVVIDSVRIQTSGTGASAPFNWTGQGVLVINSVLENVLATTGIMVSLSGYSSLVNCDVHNRLASSGSPTISVNSAGDVIGCRVSSVYGSGIGIRFLGATSTTSKGVTVSDNVIYNVLDAIYLANTQNAHTVVHGNTIVRCSGAGLKLSGTPAIPILLSNNHITDSSIGVDNASARPIYHMANRLRGIRLSDNGTPWLAIQPVTNGSGTSTDFVDYNNNNYRLIDSAPGRRTSIIDNRDIGGLQGYDTYGFANG